MDFSKKREKALKSCGLNVLIHAFRSSVWFDKSVTVFSAKDEAVQFNEFGL
jgi:hypothetical protein